MTPALDGVVYGVTPVSLWCHDDCTEVNRVQNHIVLSHALFYKAQIIQGREIVRAHEPYPPRGGYVPIVN